MHTCTTLNRLIHSHLLECIKFYILQLFEYVEKMKVHCTHEIILQDFNVIKFMIYEQLYMYTVQLKLHV